MRVSQNGQLLPETRQVIAMIARRNLVLATGHPAAEEALMMIREGRAQGVKHMVVTHAMMQPIHMSDAQMLEAAKMGAYIEFVYNGLIGSYKEFSFKDYARAIRYVGVEHCILSSDMGQPANPVHTDGLVLFFKGLKEQGFSQAEIDRMAKENPARLLGLQSLPPERETDSMVNMDRRAFLQSAAAAAVTASMPAAVQAEVSTKEKMIGIQVGAVSFVDEGVDKVLDEFQRDAAVNTLFLATFTYGRGIAGRQVPGQPLPDHGKQEYDTGTFYGGNYATIHPQYYKNTVFQGHARDRTGRL